MGNLDGRTAIVTGAGRGIGRAIALKLATEGARVVVNDLDPGPASETVLAVKTAGGEAVACPGSITEDGFAEHFVPTAVETFGGLDIIVNNAGYTWDGVIQKTSDEQWDAILDVHLKAPFRILRAAQPYFRANPAAYYRKVVNVSSIVGLSGNAGQVNYASAKAGVVGLTRTLAKEWGRYDVNVNAVAFGLIRTRLTEASAAEGGSGIEVAGREIKVGISQEYFDAAERSIPLGRAGTPEEAAGAVYLMCTPEADYITGQVVVCGGGFTG
ncbi:SDR family oxidoreductase [Streptomyces sp. NPDC048623]|uniref:SDR family NAD(P)-dependent oxidoreductase n=1 Tax=Streptomyces sp. NPDC048623 TaxID=3155761 RepID=UPI00341A8344